MSLKPLRPLDAVCLPYRGKPEQQTPLWAEFQPWQGLVMPGWFYSEDLEVLRELLYKEGYIPRVQRNHKAELKKLTVTLEKGETLVLKKKPDHAEDVGESLPLRPRISVSISRHLHGARAPTALKAKETPA